MRRLLPCSLTSKDLIFTTLGWTGARNHYGEYWLVPAASNRSPQGNKKLKLPHPAPSKCDLRCKRHTLHNKFALLAWYRGTGEYGHDSALNQTNFLQKPLATVPIAPCTNSKFTPSSRRETYHSAASIIGGSANCKAKVIVPAISWNFCANYGPKAVYLTAIKVLNEAYFNRPQLSGFRSCNFIFDQSYQDKRAQTSTLTT